VILGPVREWIILFFFFGFYFLVQASSYLVKDPLMHQLFFLGLFYFNAIIYIPYIPYLVDIVIFSINGVRNQIMGI
jgi:hypothetical protein